MTENLASANPVNASSPLPTWETARKRVNDYLKLHRLPDEVRESLLSQICQQLAHTSAASEAELIRHFIEAAQQALAALEGRTESCPKTAAKSPTGPRFERSSIRVAPLKTIELLPTLTRITQH